MCSEELTLFDQGELIEENDKTEIVESVKRI